MLIQSKKCCPTNASIVVAFEFYDGPEEGIMIFNDNESAYFYVIGLASSRNIRIFHLQLMYGDWEKKLNIVPEYQALNSTKRLFLPTNDSPELLKFILETRQAEKYKQYICAGDPYLKNLVSVSCEISTIENCKKLSGSKQFLALKKLIKST